MLFDKHTEKMKSQVIDVAVMLNERENIREELGILL